MKIVFLGQKGIAGIGARNNHDSCENRVTALAQQLVKQGHEVTVICDKRYVSGSFRSFNGVALRPAGRGLQLLAAAKLRPNSVHLSGWRTAGLTPILRLILPSASIVWTIDRLPERVTWIDKSIMKRALRFLDAISTPTRLLQYRILHEFYVKADYIPDGYEPSGVPPLNLKHFGIRPGQTYFLTTAKEAADVRFAAKAQKQAKLRNKLLVMANEADVKLRRVARDYPFVRLVGQQTGRPLSSLIAGSAGVIVAGDDTSRETLLTAMDAGRAVVATVNSLYQETAGVCAQFVHDGDIKNLAHVLTVTFSNPPRRGRWGAKAKKRAQAHFTWERLAEDYLTLYHSPLTKLVPLDSAKASLAGSSR